MAAPSSLAHRLAVGFSLLSALGTGVLLALILPAASRQLEADQRSALTQLALTAVRTLDRTMSDRYRDIMLGRTLSELRGGTPAAQRTFLERLQHDRPEFAWIGLTDPRGVVRAATGGLLEGVDVSARPWFRKGLTAPAVGDVHDAKLLAALLPRSRPELPRFVDISAPVLAADGRRLGVIGAHLSWTWVRSVEEEVLALAGRSQPVDLLVLDRLGRVLHGPSALLGTTGPAAVMDRSSAAVGSAAVTWQGRRFLAGYAVTQGLGAGPGLTWPGLGWRVVVRQDAVAAFAPIRKLQTRILEWGGLSVLLFAVLAYATAHAVTRPLSDLTTAAEAMRRQRGTAAVLPRLHDYTEVDRLSAALHELLLQREAAEQAQERLNATLEQRVEARTRQLSEANKALESFSYSVSHDLRAPLRHLAGFVPLLRQASAQQAPEKVERYLGFVERSVTEMNTLTEALLAFSRTSQEPLRCTEVDVAKLLHCARLILGPQTGSRRVQWHVGALPVVSGDERLLQQVVTNLVSNALKYTQGREPAEIRFWAEERADEWALFIRDNGAGFDPRYAERLFRVFQRLHRQDEFEGTGIGLANVRSIVTRHGGAVFADGRPGQGATFGFTLPKQVAQIA